MKKYQKCLTKRRKRPQGSIKIGVKVSEGSPWDRRRGRNSVAKALQEPAKGSQESPKG